MYYVNQLGYPHIAYIHGTEKGGVAPERRNIATSGCGLCSACMVVGNLTEVKPTIEEMIGITYDCGANCTVGSRMRLLGPAVAEKYGLIYETTNDPEALLDWLNKGGMAIANVAGDREGYKGVFSYTGHYVVILRAEGRELCIADPAYRYGKYTEDHCAHKISRIEVPLVWSDIRYMEEDVAPREIHYYLFRKKV